MNGERLSRRVGVVLLMLTSFAVTSNALAQDTRALLTAELEPGEATIWYLGHTGWAVKTQDHLLIFDYWESSAPPDDRSLSNGFVNPTEIVDQNVYVFVSHDHRDHHDPVIHGWRDYVPDITYVYGWEFTTDSQYVCLSEPRETRLLGNLKVSTINHDFDRIPEVAFLVEVDGLLLYHSGDHGTWSDSPNAVFTDNIDYLAGLGPQIDVAFMSTFGQRGGGGVINAGDRYSIERLRPRVMFPMHHGDNEDLYERFAREIRREDIRTGVYYATRPGDHFNYKSGRVEGY